MTQTLAYQQTGTAARGQAHSLFAQAMSYVAATAGLFALGAYLGRNLTGGVGIVAFIAAFAALIGTRSAARRSARLTGDHGRRCNRRPPAGQAPAAAAAAARRRGGLPGGTPGDGGRRFHFRSRLEPTTQWDTYLEALQDQRRGLNLAEGRVPATFLVADVAGLIVGRTSIRHLPNDRLKQAGGHIGYGVLPPYRRRGYATQARR